MNNETHHIRGRLASFILVLLLLSFPSNALSSNEANGIAASVIAVRGKVTATDNTGTARGLKVKDPVYLEDTIDTGKSGRIQIMFSDNSIISLARKSNMKILDYHLAQDKTGRLATKINEGVFRVMGGILTKTSPGNFKTETPSGNIGIRGSMYTGQVSSKGTSVVFEGGKGITFRNSKGLVTISKPGNGTKVGGYDQVIAKPYKFSNNEIRSMRSELSFKQSNSQPGSSSRPNITTPVTFSLATISKPDQKPSEDTTPNKDTVIESADPLLTEQVKNNPEDAALLLENAVTNQGLDVNAAMKSVLLGMKDANKETFEKLINEYLDSGGTTDDAQKILDVLKSDPGGICK